MSSELIQIREALSKLQETTTATAAAVATTANDVSWIKTGMTGLSTRLDSHIEIDGKRFGKIEGRQNWFTGVCSVISAGLAVWGERFFGGHS